LLFYAGVEKEEYDILLPVIYEENRVLLRLFSLLASGMFFALYLASICFGDFASSNSSTYLFFGAEMVILLICAHLILPKHPAIVMVLVYLFEIMLYTFGIHISMLHAEKAAVSAVAFLLVTPLLFYDRPIRFFALIAGVVAIFCLIVVHFKEPDIAEIDVWNMVTFGIVAFLSAVFTMRIKIRALDQSRKVEFLSRTDLLTGTQNRNYYESRLYEYPDLCTSNLICVYGDVNGLHEMNNKSGHSAGDRMLYEIAEALKQCFGPEHTYRVGGDEFIAVEENVSSDDMHALFAMLDLCLIEENATEKAYRTPLSISKGYTTFVPDIDTDYNKVFKRADEAMYRDKAEYYKTHDRRRG
jgi:diguanylate cyclase (GGDEF)-like protein